MIDITEELKNFGEQLSEFQKSTSQMTNLISATQEGLELQKKMLGTRVDSLKKKMHELDDDMKAFQRKHRIKTIEDLPGIKIPKWYVVDLPFEALADMNTEVTRSVIINAEGPIVITQINPVWQITQDSVPDGEYAVFYFCNPNRPGFNPTSLPTNRIIPCTAFANIVNTLGRTNTVGLGYQWPSLNQLLADPYGGLVFDEGIPRGVLCDLPEIAFQIEIIGSGRFWTNDFIPAPAFFGYDGKPLYLGISGYVGPTDKLKITAKTTTKRYAAGKVRFCVHGYEIIGKVDIAQALGY
jgi:hypothetical protein